MSRKWAAFPPWTHPVIAVRVGDTIVRALVDTGAVQSLIDPRLLHQLALPTTGSRQIVGLGTRPIEVPLVTLESVVIARCPLQPFRAGNTELTHLRLGIQLLLGIQAFRGYRLQFDFAAGRVYLLT